MRVPVAIEERIPYGEGDRELPFLVGAIMSMGLLVLIYLFALILKVLLF